MEKKYKFYYDGVFYENQEELLRAASRWCSSPISPVSFERMSEIIIKDIAANIFISPSRTNLCNGELEEILSRKFLEIIEEVREKQEKKDKNHD
ncbi:MAG TPA: hypothetical protein VN855_00520 [Candidatus Acidoferrum sp.]|nr:hypothetical protein [Candidatus Acidoferrum sp.]